ncbi:hypothetical protein NIES4102_10190 [Chondrocystis sp. NIES-4102]|nr:hypothetical protein NIES4102_10190 [Chondrocystis sp. NIES-4102]
MNNSQKHTSKAIALFLSLGLMSSLVGCDAGNTGGDVEGGEGDAPTEQTAPDEGGEGGEDG